MKLKKNKPVISRARTKQADIDRLRGAIAVAKNEKLYETLAAAGAKITFTKVFIDKMFLKAYIDSKDVELLYSKGFVKLSNG